MDEEKKTLGRAKIYSGEPDLTTRNRTQNDAEVRQTSAVRTAGRTSADKASGSAAAEGSPQTASTGDRRSRRAEPIGTRPKEHLAVEPGRRRKDMETDAKMRRLWALLGVLVVILVIALIYEIVLGHATVETGSQRMNQAVQETEQVKETEQETETEQSMETEQESEMVSGGSSAEADDGDGSASNADGADSGSGDGSLTGSDTAEGTTLAGLDG